MSVVAALPTLLSLKLRGKLTHPLRGGAEEAAMRWGCCRREGVAGAAVVVICAAVAAHLKTK